MINETELSRQYCDHHPAEAAAVLMRIAPQAAADFLTTLPPLRAAALLQYMLPGRAADILLCLDADPLITLLTRINLTAATGMLRPLNVEQRTAFLDLLPAPLHARLARVVGGPPGAGGGRRAAPPRAGRGGGTVEY